MSLSSTACFFGRGDYGMKIWGCSLIGIFAGACIGAATEYCINFAYKPTKSIDKKSRLGSLAVIIQVSECRVRCPIVALVGPSNPIEFSRPPPSCTFGECFRCSTPPKALSERTCVFLRGENVFPPSQKCLPPLKTFARPSFGWGLIVLSWWYVSSMFVMCSKSMYSRCARVASRWHSLSPCLSHR